MDPEEELLEVEMGMQKAVEHLLNEFSSVRTGKASPALIENMDVYVRAYDSVMKRDYPVVMGTLFLFTLIGLVTKLITDLAYIWVDPRVKFEGAQ